MNAAVTVTMHVTWPGCALVASSIGNKESDAETFRAHFEWDGVERKVVLGHCGKHLDHK